MRRRRRGTSPGAIAAVVLAGAALFTLGLPGVAAAMPVTCRTVSGQARDAYGAPLAGVTIATPVNDCQASATTDATGSYSIYIEPGLSGTVATATKAGYASAARTLLVTSPVGNDFQLLFDLQPGVSPAAVRSGHPLTFSARTTAPPATVVPGYPCDWGRGDRGELGNGGTVNSATPLAVSAVAGNGLLAGVNALSSHGNTLAQRSDGSVVAWGWGANGELGNGTSGTGNSSSTPVVVNGVGGSGTLGGVTAVSAGNHSLARRSDGTVVAWGFGLNGELGNGAMASSSTPVVVSGVGGSGTLTGVTAIAAGEYHSLALRSDGTVVAWGFGGNGEFGNGASGANVYSSTPVVVSGVGGTGTLTGVTGIAAGDSYSLAVRSDGSVVTWGYGGGGQLGVGNALSYSTPQVVAGVGGTGALAGVTSASAGKFHVVALRSDGTAVSWGSGGSGQLGNGSTADSYTPTIVSAVGGGGPLTGVRGVVAGGWHSVALRSDGTAVAWGMNDRGQLGDGTTSNRSTPIVVNTVGGGGTLRGATGITAGVYTTAVVDAASGCAHPNQPLVQLPNNSRLDLTESSTDGQGYTSSAATYTVPSGTADGIYTAHACAVAAGFTGNCDAASLAGLPTLPTTVAVVQYRVDNTPPVIGPQSPPPGHDTTSPRPTISAQVTDSGSGVDATKTTVSVDGTVVGTGTSSAAPGADLSLGNHTATVSATDMAGNSSTYSWNFDVVSLAGGAAYASVPSVTVQVNPNNKVPPPTQVSFVGVDTTLDAYAANLSSSISSGYGTFTRNAVYNGTVTFTNPTGQTQVVSAPATTIGYSATVGVLAAQNEPLAVSLALQHAALPTITVAIPLGFNVPGSTATLSSTHTLAGAIQLGSPDPVPSAFVAGTYSLKGGGDGNTPAATANITGGPSTGAAAAVVSVSPSLYYPCQGTGQPLCQIHAFSSVSTLAPPSDLPPSGVPCSGSACQPLLPNAPPQNGVVLSWYIGPAAQPLVRLWQSLYAYGIPSAAQPTSVLLWQHTSAAATQGACNPITSFTKIWNGTAALPSGWALAPGATGFAPSTTSRNPNETLTLSGQNYSVSETFAPTGTYAIPANPLPGAASSVANDLVPDPGYMTGARVVTGSLYRGSGTYNFSAQLGFDVPYTVC